MNIAARPPRAIEPECTSVIFEHAKLRAKKSLAEARQLAALSGGGTRILDVKKPDTNNGASRPLR
jgi:hypothetical protein